MTFNQHGHHINRVHVDALYHFSNVCIAFFMICSSYPCYKILKLVWDHSKSSCCNSGGNSRHSSTRTNNNQTQPAFVFGFQTRISLLIAMLCYITYFIVCTIDAISHYLELPFVTLAYCKASFLLTAWSFVCAKCFLYVYFIFRANDTFYNTGLAYKSWFIRSLMPVAVFFLALIIVPLTLIMVCHATYQRESVHVLPHARTHLSSAEYCVMVVDGEYFEYYVIVLSVGCVFDFFFSIFTVLLLLYKVCKLVRTSVVLAESEKARETDDYFHGGGGGGGDILRTTLNTANMPSIVDTFGNNSSDSKNNPHNKMDKYDKYASHRAQKQHQHQHHHQHHHRPQNIDMTHTSSTNVNTNVTNQFSINDSTLTHSSLLGDDSLCGSFGADHKGDDDDGYSVASFSAENRVLLLLTKLLILMIICSLTSILDICLFWYTHLLHFSYCLDVFIDIFCLWFTFRMAETCYYYRCCYCGSCVTYLFFPIVKTIALTANDNSILCSIVRCCVCCQCCTIVLCYHCGDCGDSSSYCSYVCCCCGLNQTTVAIKQRKIYKGAKRDISDILSVYI